MYFVYSFGDGVTYPIRTVDEDYDSLLGGRQRWMEDGDQLEDGGPGKQFNMLLPLIYFQMSNKIF